jgi:tetratricopeptide (TPR) repeat protein
MPHVDMLFPARRLWKRRAPRASAFTGGAAFGARVRTFGAMAPDESPGSCALTAIERDILGLHRQDDVPGWEIPGRYFGYARTGDARGLEAVFEHNRLDLLSLAAVAAVILEMASEGAEVARERHDCLALGRLLEYLDRLDDAERCFAAAALSDGMLERELDRMVRADALHWLALHRRRSRRFHEAAEAWRALLEISGIETELRREALEALAIHHEHRAKDLEAARLFALRALDLADDARGMDKVRHRLGRLSRKLDGGPG